MITTTLLLQVPANICRLLQVGGRPVYSIHPIIFLPEAAVTKTQLSTGISSPFLSATLLNILHNIFYIFGQEEGTSQDKLSLVATSTSQGTAALTLFTFHQSIKVGCFTF